MLVSKKSPGTPTVRQAKLPPQTALYPVGQPVKKVLDNGLTVIVDRIPGKLLSSLVILVHAGAIDSDEGVAHFAEHIVCDGSTAPGLQSCEELRNTLLNVGQGLNASTNLIFTNFSARVQNEDIFVPLSSYLDIIFSPRVAEDSINKHREIILRELALEQNGERTDDEQNPGKLYRELMSKLYNNHPIFDIEVLGSKESISSINRSRVLAFLSKLYTPDNIVISICGDCDPDEIFRFVENKVGSIKGKRDKNPFPPLRFTPAVLTNNTLAQSEHALLGIATEGPTNFDDPIHRQATLLLCGGLQERMFEEIREKRKIDYSPGTSYNPDHISGRFLIRVDAIEERVKETLGILSDEIKKLKREGLSEEEFKKLKTAVKLFCLDRFEKADFRATANAITTLTMNRLPELYEELESLFSVHNDEVIAQANRLLRANQMGLIAVGKKDLPSEDILRELLQRVD